MTHAHAEYCSKRVAECERAGRIKEAQCWRDHRWELWDLIIDWQIAGRFSDYYLSRRVDQLKG